MALETGTYISDLVSTNPTSSDAKSQGDDHLRFIKSAVKATFPNVTGAVTPTHTELNFVDGVTSAIQTQLDALTADKATIASPTFTGTVTIPSGASIAGFAPLASPTFTGTVTIPSGASIAGFAPLASPTFTGTVTLPATGSGSTEAVRKDYADGLVFAAVLPAQTGNAGKYITTDGTTASWQVPPAIATFNQTNYGGM